MNEFEMKELTIDDLHPDLLLHFNRYQEIQRCWTNENGNWILKDSFSTEQWDEALRKEIVAVDFTNCLKTGGFLWGAFNDDEKLIAFANLVLDFFGSEKQYLQLMQLHVSLEYRNRGLGKNFSKCVLIKQGN